MWACYQVLNHILAVFIFRFFGDPFPETLVPMRELRRMPKVSMTMSYETLLCQNMLARIKNLGNAEFWKLWWRHWVLRPFLCSSDTERAKNLDTHKHHWPLMLFWLPASVLLLVCHVLPLFSVWANYMRYGLTT